MSQHDRQRSDPQAAPDSPGTDPQTGTDPSGDPVENPSG